jgi:serine protease
MASVFLTGMFMVKQYVSRSGRVGQWVVMCGALWASVCATAGAEPMHPRLAGAGRAQEAETDRLIVHYADANSSTRPSDLSLQRARDAGARRGVQVSHRRRMSAGSDVFQLERRMNRADLQSLADELKRGDSTIDRVEPDVRLHTLAVRKTDPYLTRQWNVIDFNAGMWGAYAWTYARGYNVVVAVVDSGVLPHPDLVANLLPGYDFVGDIATANDGDGRDADASDPGDGVAADFCGAGKPAANSEWHGTHVAGIVAATGYNGEGVTGVAYNAKILPVRAIGRCGGYMSDVADGIAWAAGGTVFGVPANTRPARVINLSLGVTEACQPTMQQAINRARALGAVVVAAAGNETADVASSMPANCAGVISVAATGKTGARASYSNFGPSVTLAAPGGDNDGGIWSTLNDGVGSPGNPTYAQYMGTSMATPHVSATAALMLSVNRNLTPDNIARMMVDTAMGFVAPCEGCGAGMLNAMDAVLAALDAAISYTDVSEVEPNNTLGAAQGIVATPAQVFGSIAANTDADYYKVSVAGGSRLVASLSAGADVNDDLYVYDALGRQLGYSVLGTGQTDSVTVINSAATSTIMYVRVVRSTGALGSYTLTLEH